MENVKINSENIQNLDAAKSNATALGLYLKLQGLPEDVKNTKEASLAIEQITILLKEFEKNKNNCQLELDRLTNLVF